jgi:hypothetical protein
MRSDVQVYCKIMNYLQLTTFCTPRVEPRRNDSKFVLDSEEGWDEAVIY